MIVIVGLVVVIVGFIGLLTNAHPLPENFAVFGYHVTGSTGSLFLFGIVVGAVALLGLSVLLAGARRGHDARRPVARFQRDMTVANRDRDTRLENQQRVDEGTTPTVNSDEGATPRRRTPLLGRWSHV